MFKFDVADVYIPQDAKGSLVYNLSRRQVSHFFCIRRLAKFSGQTEVIAFFQ